MNSFVALYNKDIVASYSFIKSEIQILGEKYPMRWGVNAATLPKFRKQGLGKDCYLNARNTDGVFGVYGFTKNVGGFYKDEGFNLFKFLGQKYVRVINSDYIKFIEYWKSNFLNHKDKNNFLFFDEHNFYDELSNKKILEKLSLNDLNTSVRDEGFLKWKFNNFQTDNYERYKINTENKTSHIIIKRVRLAPTHYFATRIIDVYGEMKDLKTLFKSILEKCRERGDIYIDYCCIGDVYEALFEYFSFHELSYEENNSFPELVNPLALKENQYRIAFFSDKIQERVHMMNHENSYFTRLDSDRERISVIF